MDAVSGSNGTSETDRTRESEDARQHAEQGAQDDRAKALLTQIHGDRYRSPDELRAGVARFQASEHITPADGKVTPETLAKLDKVVHSLHGFDDIASTHIPSFLPGAAQIHHGAQILDRLAPGAPQFARTQVDALEQAGHVAFDAGKAKAEAFLAKFDPNAQIAALRVGGSYELDLRGELEGSGVAVEDGAKLKISRDKNGFKVEAGGDFKVGAKVGFAGLGGAGAKITMHADDAQEAQKLATLSMKSWAAAHAVASTAVAALHGDGVAGAAVAALCGQTPLSKADAEEMAAHVTGVTIEGAAALKLAKAVGETKSLAKMGLEGKGELEQKISVAITMNHGRPEKLAIEQEIKLKTEARAAAGASLPAKTEAGKEKHFELLVNNLTSAGAQLEFELKATLTTELEIPQHLSREELMLDPTTAFAHSRDEMLASRTSNLTIKGEAAVQSYASLAHKEARVAARMTFKDVQSDKAAAAIRKAFDGDFDGAVNAMNGSAKSMSLEVANVTQDDTKLEATLGGEPGSFKPTIESKIRQPNTTTYEDQGNISDVVNRAVHHFPAATPMLIRG